jgi:hypothetical protein
MRFDPFAILRKIVRTGKLVPNSFANWRRLAPSLRNNRIRSSSAEPKCRGVGRPDPLTGTPRLRHARFHSVPQKFSLELCDRPQNLKRKSSCWQRGVDLDSWSESSTPPRSFHFGLSSDPVFQPTRTIRLNFAAGGPQRFAGRLENPAPTRRVCS